MATDDLRDERDLLPDEDVLEERYWTPGRVIYVLIILITLIAFLAYVFAPTLNTLFNPPPPLPITQPFHQV